MTNGLDSKWGLQRLHLKRKFFFLFFTTTDMKSSETAGGDLGGLSEGAGGWAWGSGNIIMIGVRSTDVKTGEIMQNVECDVWECLVFAKFV
jgi:hypothetical protein